VRVRAIGFTDSTCVHTHTRTHTHTHGRTQQRRELLVSRGGETMRKTEGMIEMEAEIE